MLSAIFQSVFSQASVLIHPLWFLTSLLVSLILGLGLAKLYRFQSSPSREFTQILVVLPSLIAVVIFLVNGNLGTSVAVAGAFSLIKFRSPASSSKELLLVFMATAIGLATGMGYLVLAVMMSILISGVLLLLEKSTFIYPATNWQEVTICLPQAEANRHEIEGFLANVGQAPSLETAKSRQGQLELTYRILTGLSDQDLLDRLIVAQPSWSIKLSRQLKKKKSL